MPSVVSSAQVYRFGVFQADIPHKELLRRGVPVRIQDQPFRVLAALLERPGEIVSREELIRELWPEGTYVDFDAGVNAILKKLRAALDDSPENPIFIQTVPRHGYRFIAPVTQVGNGSYAGGVNVQPESVALTSENVAPQQLFLDSGRQHWLLITLASIALLLLVASLLRVRSRPHPTPRTVAVLPFANEGAGPEFDYLRYAIATDLVSDLVSNPSVNVRPFASSKRYGSQPLDQTTARKQLGVGYVVTGGFVVDKGKLRVHLELVDVFQNSSIWTDDFTTSPEQLIALHDHLASHVADSLFAAMDLRGTPSDHIPKPQNEQALSLFLHSLSISLDPGPNQLAIKKLQESLSLDDQYGPAWEELAWRYYIDYSYGQGGEPALSKVLDAMRHAEALASNTANTITLRVELGDLTGAYKEAANFLQKRPQLGTFHYEMSYVLRYAGLLREAGEQCDAALALDPGYNLYRSCATPFIFLGDYDHAYRFISLDENSGFAAKLRMLIALRTGNRAGTLAEAQAVSQTGYKFADVARLYLSHAPEAQLRGAAAQLESDPRSARDPENVYLNAEILSFSGQSEAALRELRRAIQGKHCSYPAMDKDPLFDPIRHRSEFAELRQAGLRCQAGFIATRQQTDAELQSVH